MKLLVAFVLVATVGAEFCCSDAPCTGTGQNRCDGTASECCASKQQCVVKRGLSGRPGDYTCSAAIREITSCSTCISSQRSWQEGFCNPTAECTGTVGCAIDQRGCDAYDKSVAETVKCTNQTTCTGCIAVETCNWFGDSCFVGGDTFGADDGIVQAGGNCDASATSEGLNSLYTMCGFDKSGTIIGTTAKLCSAPCEEALMAVGADGKSTLEYRDVICGANGANAPAPTAPPSAAPLAADSSAACAADLDSYCPYWVENGYPCSSKWSTDNCRTTCCGISESCDADVDVLCPVWIVSGYPCSDPWTTENCQSSCCGFSETGCAADVDYYCPYWIAHGYPCTDEWSKSNCASTCCGSDTATATDTAAATTVCEDKISSCANWANAGQCTGTGETGAFMKENCPLSCGFCGTSVTGRRLQTKLNTQIH